MKLLFSFCDLETNPVKLDNFPKGAELINFQVGNQSETVRLQGLYSCGRRKFPKLLLN